VKSDPPSDQDLLPHSQLGRIPPRRDPAFLRRWEGLSVFTTYEAAWTNAANVNWRIGALIAEIVIPDNVDLEMDGPDERGHCNLYRLSAAELRRWTTQVIRAPTIRPPSRN
jgi:hypothetical protein